MKTETILNKLLKLKANPLNSDRLNNENLKELANENAIIDAHWHYGWDEPVVSIPSTE